MKKYSIFLGINFVNFEIFHRFKFFSFGKNFKILYSQNYTHYSVIPCD